MSMFLNAFWGVLAALERHSFRKLIWNYVSNHHRWSALSRRNACSVQYCHFVFIRNLIKLKALACFYVSSTIISISSIVTVRENLQVPYAILLWIYREIILLRWHCLMFEVSLPTHACMLVYWCLFLSISRSPWVQLRLCFTIVIDLVQDLWLDP